ncbi:MAG: hypothetical protein HND27_02195 [Bacteroidetes bacterium]|nr:hypothetical protein [Bacteroidota bacterium]MBV6460940.1 hypothetical protein [Flavobacteriales bacterium]MCL4815227.1 hypothetical protein [Flavobacteriales bacterium]NOG94569.1 hypothetical protein [Bacteroidota bacterium]CAG0950437.1 hypothetical protein FLAV_00167 [Flavobacteriales bacterium]
MKNIIVSILLLSSLISLTACGKCMVYYACCNTGHAPWQGRENVSCGGDRAETNIDAAEMQASQHDDAVHGGISTAKVCSVYKKPQ